MLRPTAGASSSRPAASSSSARATPSTVCRWSRAAHPRVPARGLRRRRRPRRVPRPRACTLVDVTVHCWGAERRRPAEALRSWPTAVGGARGPSPHAAALQAVSVDLAMAAGVDGADLVHSHTWYANLGGHLAKLSTAVHMWRPCTASSRCGRGRRSSSAAVTPCRASASGPASRAADAVIAVSRRGPRPVAVLSGGRSEPCQRDPQRDRHGASTRLTGDGRPRALRRRSRAAVGRLRGPDHTAERGRAPAGGGAPDRPWAQIVLCAGAPDTPEIAAEIEAKVERVRQRGGIVGSSRCSRSPT